MTARQFETTRWEPLVMVSARAEEKHKAVEERWKFRHYIAALSFILLAISPLIGAISRDWIWAAMVASIALLLFFVFALLIPSNVYHLDEEHDFGQ